MTLPLYFGPNGIEPEDASSIRDDLVNRVLAINPGFTANMPGLLIEDIVSTCSLALVQMDQAKIEAINCLTPFASNTYTFSQLGEIYGISLNEASRTSVYVEFSGTPGYIIQKGFLVSDGSYQYAVQEAGVINNSGKITLYCIAIVDNPPSTNQGWPVPKNTVTAIVTSVPAAYTVTCTNPEPGTPGAGQEEEIDYRQRVLQAGYSYQQGSISYLKTQLEKIKGVQKRLISVVVVEQPVKEDNAEDKEITPIDGTTGGVKSNTIKWLKIIVGGGDPYEIANAILNSQFDIVRLIGSLVESRTIVADIVDGQDIYSIPFVVPFAQELGVNLVWNTVGAQILANDAVSSVSLKPMIDFINSTPVRQHLNVYLLQGIFQKALSQSIAPELITKIDFTFTIDGQPVEVLPNTGMLPSNSEGYFITDEDNFTIQQG